MAMTRRRHPAVYGSGYPDRPGPATPAGELLRRLGPHTTVADVSRRQRRGTTGGGMRRGRLLALSAVLVGLFAWMAAHNPGPGLLSARGMVAMFSAAVLVVLLAALPAGGTDLRLMSAASSGSAVWGDPSHWCAMLAFALVVVCETGRQPVDNPDTHLELTMIHEGPLLEYAGRDLAYLQWAAAARHWLMLLLGAGLFLPHWGPFWVRLVLLIVALPLFAVALAVNETWQAKMRLIRVPRFLGAGVLVALLGLAGWILGGGG